MRKLIVFLCFMLVLNVIQSQVFSKKFNYQIGSGISLAGKGNIIVCYENELNYKINNYFSSSFFIDFGRSIGYSDHINDFFQSGVNLYVSPLKNNRQNNFKIGAGLGIMNDLITEKLKVNNSGNYDIYYELTKETGGVYNFIIEDEYWINSRFMIGGKLFTSKKFVDRELIIGGIIKFGVSL